MDPDTIEEGRASTRAGHTQDLVSRSAVGDESRADLLQRLTLLVDASAVLDESLDADRLLSELSALLVERFADGCEAVLAGSGARTSGAPVESSGHVVIAPITARGRDLGFLRLTRGAGGIPSPTRSSSCRGDRPAGRPGTRQRAARARGAYGAAQRRRVARAAGGAARPRARRLRLLRPRPALRRRQPRARRDRRRPGRGARRAARLRRAAGDGPEHGARPRAGARTGARCSTSS